MKHWICTIAIYTWLIAQKESDCSFKSQFRLIERIKISTPCIRFSCFRVYEMQNQNEPTNETYTIYMDKLKGTRRKQVRIIKEVPNSVYFITKYIPFMFRLGGIFVKTFRCSLSVLMRTSTMREIVQQENQVKKTTRIWWWRGRSTRN